MLFIFICLRPPKPSRGQQTLVAYCGQEKDGWFLGYLNDYPGHWTQGKTVKELEETLIDLYELEQEEQPNRIPERSISASLNRRADKSGGGAFFRALTGNAVIP
ncbi:MAG: hypothetical protein LBG73_04695 [Spirochaetaceae bacterium]|nr:hypothetical protein [Spirochaetaceae bacterium]